MTQLQQNSTWYRKFFKWLGTWPGTIFYMLFIILFLAQNFIIPSGSMIKTMLIGDMLFVKKFAYGVPTPHLPWLEMPLIPGADLKNNPSSGHLINGDTPKRGDVVVFRYPPNPKVHYIKRCVALPGDELFVKNKDLYLHPHEGDQFIQSHYPQKLQVNFDGKIWIKNPYREMHPGIQHDDAITLATNTMSNGMIHNEEIFYFAPFKVPKDEYFMMGDNRDHSNDSRSWGTVPYGLVEGTPWFVYFSIADDYSIRWDRVGKSIEDIEVSLKKGLY